MADVKPEGKLRFGDVDLRPLEPGAAMGTIHSIEGYYSSKSHWMYDVVFAVEQESDTPEGNIKGKVTNYFVDVFAHPEIKEMQIVPQRIARMAQAVGYSVDDLNGQGIEEALEMIQSMQTPIPLLLAPNGRNPNRQDIVEFYISYEDAKIAAAAAEETS